MDAYVAFFVGSGMSIAAAAAFAGIDIGAAARAFAQLDRARPLGSDTASGAFPDRSPALVGQAIDQRKALPDRHDDQDRDQNLTERQT